MTLLCQLPAVKLYHAATRQTLWTRLAAFLKPKGDAMSKPARYTIYLAGPMQGYPEFNFPAFNAAAAKLRAEGHIVFNPAEKDIERHNGNDISSGNKSGSIEEATQKHGFSLREALRDDTHFICMEANAIALLPGWEHSSGAMAEFFLAKALKHHFIYLA